MGARVVVDEDAAWGRVGVSGVEIDSRVVDDVVCHNNDNHEKAMERALAQRKSYDVRFSLRCCPKNEDEARPARRDSGDRNTEREEEGEGSSEERIVNVGVEWMPPRSR